MYKRLLITALLLAALAAAGGDEIKWTKSKELDFIPLNTTVDYAELDYLKTLEKYKLIWSPAFSVGEISFISAIFCSWDVQCLTLSITAKEHNIEDTALRDIIEKARGVNADKTYFYINLSVINEDYKNLMAPDKWTITLDDGVSTYQPTSIEKIHDPFEGIDVYFDFISRRGVFKTRYAGEASDLFGINLYRVAFPRPYNNIPSGSLKLALMSKAAHRGFEWRFK